MLSLIRIKASRSRKSITFLLCQAAEAVMKVENNKAQRLLTRNLCIKTTALVIRQIQLILKHNN